MLRNDGGFKVDAVEIFHLLQEYSAADTVPGTDFENSVLS
jgi:hypothetical protein